MFWMLRPPLHSFNTCCFSATDSAQRAWYTLSWKAIFKIEISWRVRETCWNIHRNTELVCMYASDNDKMNSKFAHRKATTILHVRPHTRPRVVTQVQLWVSRVTTKWWVRISGRLGRVGSESELERFDEFDQFEHVTRDWATGTSEMTSYLESAQTSGFCGFFWAWSGVLFELARFGLSKIKPNLNLATNSQTYPKQPHIAQSFA